LLPTRELSFMPSKSSLNVSLTPELTAFITAKINSGRYRSASEVVRAALRLPDERERRVDRQTKRVADAPSTR
jgi:antitoxin ParD1/3/4